MTLKHAFLAILCAVCAAAPALAETYNGTVFTSSPVSVKAGQDFLIALPSNPTTGYSWKGQSNNGNVSVEGSSYEASANSGKMMGAGGQQIFVLEAKSAGTSTVTFSYGRPWQKGVKPAKTMTFTVTVTK